MTRFLSEHYRKDGQPKVAYETRREVVKAAVDSGMKPYQCSVCQKFHLGNSRRRRYRM